MLYFVLLTAIFLSSPFRVVGTNPLTVEVDVENIKIDTIFVDGNPYTRITIPGTYPLLEKGKPTLPQLTSSLILEDRGEYEVSILEEEWEEVSVAPPLPSKGHISRRVNPEDLPLEFSSVYREDTWFPEKPFILSTPYILRDFRGTVLRVYPVQYNGKRGKIRILKHALIRLEKKDLKGKNEKRRKTPLKSVDHDFAKIYELHFLNYSSISSKYNLIEEPGRLLIITPDIYFDAAYNLARWKRERGIPVKLAVYPDSTGAGATSIKSYIESLYYSDSSITYIIIVGDVDFVPTMYGTYEGAPSDPMYVKLEGDDHYPDALISRIPANSPDNALYQVEKFIKYEKFPDPFADWYHKASGIASNEDGGTGIPDWQRAEWLRDSLMSYTYTLVDQIYDPGATSSQVTLALNEGRSLVNYIGHGSAYSWATTGFSISNIYSLQNGWMDPFIIDVACDNGDFTLDECFAEAWLRAGSLNDPKGAIGIYASSTSASWVPPCVMQAEAVRLLINEIRISEGGLSFNGVMRAMDEYFGTGEDVKLMEQYNLFGDCSLILRTDTPESIQAYFPEIIPLGSSELVVQTQEEGLFVSLTRGDTLIASSLTDQTGEAVLQFTTPITQVGGYQLVVYGYNKLPLIDTIEAVIPNFPYITISGYVTSDSTGGNGNGIPNPGETLKINLEVVNLGTVMAQGINATLRTEDSLVSLIDSVIEIGDVEGGDTVSPSDGFTVILSPLLEDQHMITLEVRFSDVNDSTWSSYIHMTVEAPILYVSGYTINDSLSGNGNNLLEPGETAQVRINIMNSGSGEAENVSLSLESLSPLIYTAGDTVVIENIEPGGGVLSPGIEVTASDTAPQLAFPAIQARLINDFGVEFWDTFTLIIGTPGFSDNMENGQGDWTHYAVSPSFHDEWNLSTIRNHTLGGTTSWHCGSTTYGDSLDAALMTPPIAVGENYRLIIWHWMDAETSNYYTGYCYDGGLVEISTDSGITWTQLFPEGGYNFKMRPGGPFPQGTEVFSGHFDWKADTFDLSQYTGLIFIRFRFGSDHAITREGWYIDDVVVEAPEISIKERVPLERVQLSRLLILPTVTKREVIVSFEIPRKMKVTVNVYDVAGRRVRSLFEGKMEPGRYNLRFDLRSERGRRLPAGVYFVTLKTEEGRVNRKLILLK